MPVFIVRVWVPDRPGALGAVASRVGAVRGDVVGIDILERGGGRAIDELVVELPDAALVSLLVSEVSEVDGVDVEDVRRAPEHLLDPRLDALETAEVLVAAASLPRLLGDLVARARHDFEADWAAVVDCDDRVLRASQGTPPPPPWLCAFVDGGHSSAMVASGECGPDDVAWSSLAGTRLAAVLGRRGRPFRARERRQLAALVRIAEHRAAELELAPSASAPAAAPGSLL